MRRIARILLTVVLLAVVLVGGGLAALTLTEAGRDRLAALASSLASGPDQRIDISGISGLWAGPLRVERVVVSDRDGAWLTVDGLETDLSYTALLAGRISADDLTVTHLDVARRPAAPAQASADRNAFRLPIDIDIQAISLPAITLGPDLAGGGAHLSAQGKLVATANPLCVETKLSAARTDGNPGDLSVNLVYDPTRNQLDVALNGAEPQGGILANFLRLPDAPPLSIAIEGSGPASDWQGQGAMAVDERVVIKLAGRHRAIGADHRVELTGEGEFQPFLPLGFGSLAEGKTLIDVAGSYGQGGAIAVERARIDSDRLSMAASGRVDPDGTSDLRLTATAKGEDVGIAAGEGDDTVRLALRRLDATVSGTGRTPAVALSLILPELATPQGTLTDVGLEVSSTAFDIGSRTGPVQADITIGAVSTRIAGLAPYLAGRVVAAATAVVGAEQIDFAQATIRTDALTAQAEGTFVTVDGSARIGFQGDVAASALPAAVRHGFGDRLAVSGDLVRAADGGLTLSGFEARSGVLSAGGSASLARGEIALDLTGSLSDLGGLSHAAAGAVTFTARVEGPMVGPQATLRVVSDRIESGGQTLTDVALAATGTVNAQAPQAELTLSAKVEGQALDGRGRLTSDDTSRRIDDLMLSLGANRIAGSLALDDAFLPRGRVTLDIADIAPLAALALQTASGEAKGGIDFSVDNGVPTVRVDALVPAFKRGDVSGRDVAVELTVADYVDAPRIEGRVRAASVEAGTTSIGAIDVTLTPDGPWTGFDGRVTAAGIPVEARGRVQFVDGTVTVDLAEGGATLRGVTASLAQRSTLVYRDEQARFDGFALGVGGGRAVITGTAGQSLALNVALSGVPASLANAFAPGLGAAGTASGTARITGPAASPSIAYDLRLAGAQTAQTREAGFGAMAIDSSGTFTGGVLRFKATVGDGSGLTMQGGGTVATAGARALDLSFSGRVPFGFLTRRLAAQGLSLSGTADVSLAVGGTIAAPAPTGTIRASGARFVDVRSGIAIGDIAADIALARGVATLRSLKGAISSGGSITAGGTVGIDAGGGFPADLTVKVVDGRYTDGRLVTSSFSGDIAVKGPLAAMPTLSGTVNLGRTVITVPERLPTSLSKLNVKHRNASGAVAAQAEALRPVQGGSSSGGLVLDLTVNAPQQIFVQGRGIDAELGGTLRLQGPVSSPSATGLFTMRRGRMSIIGRRLDFTSGTVGFSGSLVPMLDFAASSSTNSSTVTVTITGPANNPAFGFASSPAAPEDEVLAQLVFGRSLSNLSAVQIAQLASAAASLAGIGGSTSLLQTLQGKLGVDDIDVRTDDETGDTSVSVGKYLNDRTYITIEKGAQPGSGKAAIDLNVGRGVKLRGEAADDGSTKGGIFFEREY